MPNTVDIIMHNKAILHQADRKTQIVDKLCNCRNPRLCPLARKCKGLIMYKTTLTLQNKSMVYYGSCGTEFKSRYSNHKQSFKFKGKKHATELSKAIWNVKDAGETHFMKWSIIERVPPYQYDSKTCQLCLAEKVASIKIKRKFICLCCERLNRSSFFWFKMATNFTLSFQFLHGLDTNFWLQDRNLRGARPRPRLCLNNEHLRPRAKPQKLDLETGTGLKTSCPALYKL